jgi:hypothetical protein
MTIPYLDAIRAALVIVTESRRIHLHTEFDKLFVSHFRIELFSPKNRLATERLPYSETGWHACPPMPTKKAFNFQKLFLSRPSSSRKPFVQRRIAHSHQLRDARNAESGAFHKDSECRDERLLLLALIAKRLLLSPTPCTIELAFSIHTSSDAKKKRYEMQLSEKISVRLFKHPPSPFPAFSA